MIYLPKFFYNGVLFSFDNVIVAGGREPNLQWFKQLVDSKEVHCADHGMDLCYKANIIPKTIVGDMDSCDPLALNFFQKCLVFLSIFSNVFVLNFSFVLSIIG